MTEESVNAGQLLQQRREALGLTTAQVAQQLNLKASAIAQIEALQFDGSVAPTFIRGYLKLYARLLKLNERQVLSQFEPHLQASAQPVAMHSFSHRTSRDAAESRFKLATYFLAVLLIGLLLVWFWQTHLLDNEPVLSVNTVNSANELTGRSSSYQSAETTALPITSSNAVSGQNADSDGLVESQSKAASTTETTAAMPTQPAVRTTTPTENAELVVESAAEPTAEQGAALAPATTAQPTATAQATSTQPTAGAADSSVATAQPANTSSAATVTATPANSDNASQTNIVSALTFQFSANCWLEVTDANGKRLAYQMAGAGQQVTLQGQLPLKVVLGDPSVVQLSRDGQPVDLSAYQSGRAARLTFTGSN